MDKQTLIRNMQQSCGGAGFLSVKQIAAYRGEHVNTTTKFLKGMEYVSEGKKKLYFVGDVAERILEHRVRE